MIKRIIRNSMFVLGIVALTAAFSTSIPTGTATADESGQMVIAKVVTPAAPAATAAPAPKAAKVPKAAKAAKVKPVVKGKQHGIPRAPAAVPAAPAP